jgi:thiamine biosynthesis lipoprotein
MVRRPSVTAVLLTFFFIIAVVFMFRRNHEMERPRPIQSTEVTAPSPMIPPETSRWWPSMGSWAGIHFWGVEPDSVDPLADDALQTTQGLEMTLSRYWSDSDVSRVNRQAGDGEPVPVGDDLVRLMIRTLDLVTATDGCFDPTVAPLVTLWGLDLPWRGQDVLPPIRSRIEAALGLVGSDGIDLDPGAGTLRLTRTGMDLDLGGIGKGYTLDRAAGMLEGRIRGSALLILGGQIMILGPSPAGDRWRLGILDPRDPDRIAAVASITGGSLATSGDYERYVFWEGERHGHVLDPRSGYPVTGSTAVTVWAPDATMADAWSTALLVAGPDEGLRLLAGRPELGVVWIDDPGDGVLSPEHFHVAGALQGRIEILP